MKSEVEAIATVWRANLRDRDRFIPFLLSAFSGAASAGWSEAEKHLAMPPVFCWGCGEGFPPTSNQVDAVSRANCVCP